MRGVPCWGPRPVGLVSQAGPRCAGADPAGEPRPLGEESCSSEARQAAKRAGGPSAGMRGPCLPVGKGASGAAL